VNPLLDVRGLIVELPTAAGWVRLSPDARGGNLVLFLKAPGTIDLENPVATNLAAFFPEDTAKWLQAFGKNMDIFARWVVALIGIGFAATDPKKLQGGTSFGIAFGMFAAYVVIRVGLAFAFS
jgi:hypothetical protein